MTLIPSGLISDWQAHVSDLNTDLGHTCTLHFESGQTEVSNISASTDGLKPPVIMPYGGRSHGFATPGQQYMSENVDTPGNFVQVNESTKDITARVYHVLRDFARFNIQVSENTNVYEVVCRKIYIPDLVRAKHIVLFSSLPEKTIKAKLVRPPVPYGLGALYQCRSFWQEI